NLSKQLHKHFLKAGFEFRAIRANQFQYPDVGALFSFDSSWTQGPDPTRASATAGFGFATFLAGVAGGAVPSVPALAQQNLYHAVFLQDDYRITPRLTLNLGVRYDYEAPRTDRFNQLSNFDFAVKPPLTAPGLNLAGGLVFPGTGGLSRFQADPDRNNLAPRVGAAYRLTKTTVLRSGGGLFYGNLTGFGSGAGSYGISGYATSTTVVTSLDGV